MNTINCGTTSVPNVVFDLHLKELKPAELKLLLVIIRQTLGWIDKATNKRKEKDWLSGSQLRLKTGCSRRALTDAIEVLTTKKLIEVSDCNNFILQTPEERKGQKILYYRFCCAENALAPKQNMHITKETFTKKIYQKEQTENRSRFTSSDLQCFETELTQSGSLNQLLCDKHAVKMEGDKQTIVCYEYPEQYRNEHFTGYVLPSLPIQSLRVPYSVWMELYHCYLKIKKK